MKHSYAKYLQPIIVAEMKESRLKKKIPQSHMAALLRITTRSYNELENGKTTPCMATFIFLLIQMQDGEILRLVQNLRVFITQLEEQIDPST